MGTARSGRIDGAGPPSLEDAVSEPLLPSGVDVAFTDIEVTLLRDADSRHVTGRALTATVVAAGPSERLVEAVQAIDGLKGVGVRAVLISHGDNPAPVPR